MPFPAKKKPAATSLVEQAAAMGDEDDESMMPSGMMSSPEGGEPEGEGDLDDEVFMENIVVAFPELEGSPERIDALKAAMEACVRKSSAGGYDEELG